MNGHVHALTSYVLAVPVGLTAGLLARDLAAGALAAVGCVAGVLLSPDLDHEAITESEALVYRRGGQVLGSLWRTYWMPYALLIPHRHWLSHAPLIGTLGRLLYLLAPFVISAAARGRLLTFLAGAASLWPMLVGLAASDLAHWVMDL